MNKVKIGVVAVSLVVAVVSWYSVACCLIEFYH